MLLHDIIVAAYPEGFSGVYVNTKTPHEACKRFMALFDKAYHQAMDDLEEETGAVCTEKEDNIPCPASIKPINAQQFLILLNPLFLNVNDGARADNAYLTNALETTLKQLMTEFTDMSYYGMIAYEWCDEHCGDVINYEISSDEQADLSDVLYPFVEDTFKEIFAQPDTSDEFWEKIEDDIEMWETEDAEKIIACFEKYHQPEEFIEKIKELVEELIDD